MAHTAYDMVQYIKNYRYKRSDYILHPSIHNLLTLIYGFIFWMIFLPTIGLYLGVFVFTNHLLIPELYLIVGVLLFWMIVHCTQEFKYSGSIWPENIFLLFIVGIFKAIEILLIRPIVVLLYTASGLIVACILERNLPVDPRFFATVMMNLSMMFSCFRLSLSLRHVCWISLISGLGISHLLGKMSIVKPEGFIEGFVVTVLISAAVMTFVSYRVSLAARVEHAGWLYFSGILLTWLATDFLMPYTCITHGKLLIFSDSETIELVLDRESYSHFQGYGYKFDSWNNYYQYHIHIQLGLLGMCGFVIHQTQLLVKMYRGCPPYVRWNWEDARRHSVTILENFIKIWRPLIQPIIWGVMFPSSYLWTKLSALIDKIFTMCIKSSMIFIEPCNNFFIKLHNMCFEPFIDLTTNICRFFKILYDTLDLVHAFVAIVHIYVIYRVYLFLQ